MRINDLLMMSIRSLWRRKLRTFLTILGVIIGASSIILMLSLGIAMNSNFRAQMESMSSLTVIEVWANNWEDPNAPKLDDKAVESLSKIPGVQRVIPQESINGYLEIGKYRSQWSMNLIAMDPEDLEALGYAADIGEPIPQGEKNYIVFGQGYSREFAKKGKRPGRYTMNDPIAINPGDAMEINLAELDWETGKPVTGNEGQKVKPPKNVKVKVSGLYNEMTPNGYSVFISRDLFTKLTEEQKAYRKKLYGKDDPYGGRYQDPNKYQNIKVKVANEDDVVAIQQQITDMGFRGYSPMEYLDEMKKVASSIQLILGGIGAISLFVAAIGITNTMMMSIYERTKEIGVMKVIGARLTDIKKMFLMEALMIGAIGGSAGVIFSYGISFIMNKFAPQIAASLNMSAGAKISEIPPWLALAALLFATLIGLLSGYFPARRAMKLSALSAIRTE